MPRALLGAEARVYNSCLIGICGRLQPSSAKVPRSDGKTRESHRPFLMQEKASSAAELASQAAFLVAPPGTLASIQEPGSARGYE